jgi:hypothetical protein
VTTTGSAVPITATISSAQSPVPEPSSCVLVGAGAAMLVWRRSRKAHAA